MIEGMPINHEETGPRDGSRRRRVGGGGGGGRALPYGDERGASDRSTLPPCVISML